MTTRLSGREIVAALRCGKPNCPCGRPNSGLAHCPAHNDAHPSLSVTEKDGKPLIHCHTGCTQQELIAALTERGLWGGRDESQSETPIPIRSGTRQLVRVYEFRDATGALIAEHGRFEMAGGRKAFAWRIPGQDWRDGLGSVSIADLPLYGLQRVLDAPNETVWIVEGEKAADAAYEAGLTAVCLGGGANQQAFGNSLDVLRDRAVVLWPDNDEAGATLMGRLAALLPQAHYCRPIVPPKGDAFDYFAAGGKVDALFDLLNDGAPRVEVIANDAVRVTVPVASGQVRCTFEGLTAGPRSLDAMMRIEVEVPGKRKTAYSTRLNLESSSARESMRREVQGIYPGKDIEWTALIAEACDLAKEMWRGIDRSTDLMDVTLPEVRRWLIDHFAPHGMTTIVFGMGGSQKSLLTGHIAIHALYGWEWFGRHMDTVPGVLIVDYEDAADEWRLRIQQLADAAGLPYPIPGIRYMNGNGIPFADQQVQIRRLVEENNIGLIIVDSAISACGGDLLDTQAAQRLVNALHDLGVSALLIAHNTKAEDSQYPYGSIFWHNLVRATHYMEARQEEGAKVSDVAIYNRKANRGLQRPIALRVTYSEDDTGPTTIQLMDRLAPALRKATLKDEIVSYLNEVRSDDASAIAKALGHARSKVVDLLTTDATFQRLSREGKRVLYGLSANVSPYLTGDTS